MARRKPRRRLHWAAEQALLCLVAVPTSFGAYRFYSTLALEPGPHWLGRLVLFGMSVSLLIGFIQAIAGVGGFLWLAMRGLQTRYMGDLGRWMPLLVVMSAASTYPAIAVPENREAGLVRIVHRGQKVVDDMIAFYRVHGRIPLELGELYPDGAAPTTGSMSYDKWELIVVGKEAGFELRVRASTGGFNGDALVYWPGAEYPSEIDGKSVELVEDWAYLRD